MVAGDVDDARALATLPEQLLNHIIMGLWPVKAFPLHAPAIDDVTDQIDRVCVMLTQKIHQHCCLAIGSAQMDI